MTSPERAHSDSGASTPPQLQRLGRRVSCVGYHVISPQPLDSVRFLFPTKTPQQFEDDVAWMQAHGTLIGYDQLADAAKGRLKLNGRTFHISFDDGMAQCKTLAAPLLARLGATATFFVTTDFLDNRVAFYRNVVSLCLARLDRADAGDMDGLLASAAEVAGRSFAGKASLIRWLRGLYHPQRQLAEAVAAALGVDLEAFLSLEAPYLTSAQVQQLAAAGHTIGAHSLSHPRFRVLADADRIEHEIVESCRIVAELTGQQEVPFSLPFGGSHLSRGQVAQIHRRFPFVGLFFDTSGVPSDAAVLLPRVIADNPRGAREGRSNLGTLILRARVRRFGKWLKALFWLDRLRRWYDTHWGAQR